MWFWQIRWNQNDCIPSERRPTSEFQEETWSEFLSVDFDPTGRIDQKAEHVLFTTVQSCASIERRLWRLKISRHVANNFQQLGIPLFIYVCRTRRG